jgi:hypothetical protein
MAQFAVSTPYAALPVFQAQGSAGPNLHHLGSLQRGHWESGRAVSSERGCGPFSIEGINADNGGQRSRGTGEKHVQKSAFLLFCFSSGGILAYSYRSAETGSTRDALQAGTRAATTATVASAAAAHA